ncbi:MAG: DUF58 domain-containing protein [Rhodobacteraceae bacterium]|nr:DUF58 domain-containing protein [Paracoccaceae bacterium]
MRARAQALAGALPPLLADAERLAANVAMGAHGRRRAGNGESFWQYRHAMPGDSLASIDWRRSAQGDALFIREREWEASQTVGFWVDPSKAMDYFSGKLEPKSQRAKLLALACASLLSRAGERVSLLASPAARPGFGQSKLHQMALALAGLGSDSDYGPLPHPHGVRGGHRLFFSDFMGDESTIFPALSAHAEAGNDGAIIHILDPSELSFPYDGRIIFESMGGLVDFETRRAKALRDEYLARLDTRSERLKTWAHRAGWHYLRHSTDTAPKAALLWLFNSLGAGR